MESDRTVLRCSERSTGERTKQASLCLAASENKLDQESETDAGQSSDLRMKKFSRLPGGGSLV
jgi:hypothetical protein